MSCVYTCHVFGRSMIFITVIAFSGRIIGHHMGGSTIAQRCIFGCHPMSRALSCTQRDTAEETGHHRDT